MGGRNRSTLRETAALLLGYDGFITSFGAAELFPILFPAALGNPPYGKLIAVVQVVIVIGKAR